MSLCAAPGHYSLSNTHTACVYDGWSPDDMTTRLATCTLPAGEMLTVSCVSHTCHILCGDSSNYRWVRCTYHIPGGLVTGYPAIDVGIEFDLSLKL